jgi:hypothetical protein
MNSLFQFTSHTAGLWSNTSLSYYSRYSYPFDLSTKVDIETVFKNSKSLHQLCVESVHYSLSFSRKIHNLEPRIVKSYLLVHRLAAQIPFIQEGERPLYTVTLKTDVNRRKRLLVSLKSLFNYLKSVNFFGFSPMYFSAPGQINFAFIEHLPLARYMGIQYDYFAWKNPLKLTFSFAPTRKKKESRLFILYFFNSIVNIS